MADWATEDSILGTTPAHRRSPKVVLGQKTKEGSGAARPRRAHNACEAPWPQQLWMSRIQRVWLEEAGVKGSQRKDGCRLALDQN
ncbi:hypothetical protein ACLOJK_028396 [Asimina triloba]